MIPLQLLFADVQQASRKLTDIGVEEINHLLRAVADAAMAQQEAILEANRQDLARMDASDPKYDRLKLTPERIQNIAADIRHVAELPSPVGRVLSETTRPNGLYIRKVSVPFGVIGIIYEARPNVTFDVFSLCLKSGNACILKGGSDADCTNRVIVSCIHSVLNDFHVNPHLVELLPADREATTALLHAEGYVDLLIPRGGQTLIDYVRGNATIPVIETGAGVCHTYFDRYGDAAKGAAIICNAKTRRVSVCNALDTLLIHRSRLADLPALCQPLKQHNVHISYDDPADYGKEFLDYRMAVVTVDSMTEALEHIHTYSSKHSECIITEDKARAERFCREVDAACVYVNAPTSFTDGAQFGLGAEIGISTQKMHARGPMGLEELTTYKWIIEGNGQIRS
ncbi:MAG: glutamate-5-semialdehyde dehydrogenase [Prevotellaceae bacterium]|jgi:glutamate-5-semialdehyde dehydrogenase|nr:glutamate-5-semialdehyde dehydrogenase [Prevotellaceae bacterium]